MIVAVNTKGPVAVPVTRPVVEINATPILLLLHVPSGVTSLNDVVNPWQTDKVPNIAPGSGFTVTTAVVKQPVDKV